MDDQKKIKAAAERLDRMAQRAYGEEHVVIYERNRHPEGDGRYFAVGVGAKGEDLAIVVDTNTEEADFRYLAVMEPVLDRLLTRWLRLESESATESNPMAVAIADHLLAKQASGDLEPPHG